MTRFVKRFITAIALTLGLLTPVAAAADGGVSPEARHVVDYISAHGVSVIHTSDGGALIVLETEFPTSRMPDLRVGLGKAGLPMPEAELGMLQKITGLQVFKAPASVDVTDYDELYIWEAQSSALIGAAPLG